MTETKTRVFYDLWFRPNLKVRERDVLMFLWREMNFNNKAYLPSWSYLNKELGISNSEAVVKGLKEKGLIKRVVKDQMIEIVMERGKSTRVPTRVWFLGDRWERTLMLTFYLLKKNQNFLWTTYAELMALFDTSARTILEKLKHLEDRGLIVRNTFKKHHRILILY